MNAIEPRSLALRRRRLSSSAIPTRSKQLCVLTMFVLKKGLIYLTVLSGNEGQKVQGAMQGEGKLIFPKVWMVIYLLREG